MKCTKTGNIHEALYVATCSNCGSEFEAELSELKITFSMVSHLKRRM